MSLPNEAISVKKLQTNSILVICLAERRARADLLVIELILKAIFGCSTKTHYLSLLKHYAALGN